MEEPLNKENKYRDEVLDSVNDADPLPSEATQRVVMSPQDYLAQYYRGEVSPLNKEMLRFYAKVYEDLGGRSLLEFGGGPTIYSLITAARTVSSIHFCDYNAECLDEVNKWLMEDNAAFDWSYCTKYALSCEEEGRENISEEDIQARHKLIRQRIRKISRCDILADDPLLGSSMGPYGVVASAFCLNCIIEDKREWFYLNKKLANLVDKDGLFVTASTLNSSYWMIQNVRYPAVKLTPDDISNMYSELRFSITYSDVIDSTDEEGHEGFIVACGERL